MDAEFWHARWRDNAIAFHKAEVNHYLEKYFDRLGLTAGAEVLVPLCGKSIDMRWLAARGCRVRGVELSGIAVRDFFDEQGIAATSHREGAFEVTQGAGITLMCGDFFDLEATHTAAVSAIYDRAALIALPAATRGRYAERLLALAPSGAPILLLTLEYPAGEVEGPPFSVDDTEVRRLFESRRRVERLESLDRLDDEPALAERGLTRLVEHAFLLSTL